MASISTLPQNNEALATAFITGDCTRCRYATYRESDGYERRFANHLLSATHDITGTTPTCSSGRS